MCWVLTRAAFDADGDYESTKVLRVCVGYRVAREALKAELPRSVSYMAFEDYEHDEDGQLVVYSVTFPEGVTYTLTRSTLDRGL